MSFFSCSTYAKNNKAAKEEEKRIQAIADSLNFALASRALDSLDFVIAAERITFKRGKSVYVESNTNFIKAKDGNAVVQIASIRGNSGYNGLGGITVKGMINNVKKKYDKKGNLYLEFSVNGVNISARVSINLPKNSDNATVTVYPNFNSENMTLFGKVLSAEAANIFQGRTL